MMKRILLLTIALLSLIAGQAVAIKYQVPRDLNELGGATLQDGDIIELTGNVTDNLTLTTNGSPINITVQSEAGKQYTLTSDSQIPAIGIYRSLTLTLKDITVGDIGVNNQEDVFDIILKTEGKVTVSSGIKANDNVQAGSKLTIDGSAWQNDDVVKFKGAGSCPAELNNLDVTISGGQPQFIYEGVFDNISAFQTTKSVIIKDSNPVFSARGIALQAKNLTITGNSSPKFTSTNNGSALLLSGDALTISSSDDCFFTNNSSDYNTIQFEEDATLNVEGMNGTLKVINEVKYESPNDQGYSAISSDGKLNITGRAGGDGKIVAIGAERVINAKEELLIDAHAKIEASLNATFSDGDGDDTNLLSSFLDYGLTVQNAEITLKGSSDMVYFGMTMESGVLNLDGKILAHLTIGENAQLYVAPGASTRLGIEGKTILNNGTIVNEGTLTFAHKLTNNGTIQNDGTLINNALTVLNNYGVLNTSQNIINKGTINNYKPIEGNGKIVNEDKGVTNELWQTVNTTYYTIALEVSEGIACSYTSGSHSIAEDDHLYLTFYTENPELTADDILFMIDGVESPFNVSMDGKGGSYILNPVTADKTIVIALREFPVTLPEIEGLTISATEQPIYGQSFTFTIQSETLDLSQMKVFVNGTELEPNALRAEAYSYTIAKVEGPITITIEGIEATGNADLTAGKIDITMINNQLSMSNSGPAVDVAVYNITGKNVVSLRGLCGSKTITLPAGVYVVRAGQQTWKVMVND